MVSDAQLERFDKLARVASYTPDDRRRVAASAPLQGSGAEAIAAAAGATAGAFLQDSTSAAGTDFGAAPLFARIAAQSDSESRRGS